MVDRFRRSWDSGVQQRQADSYPLIDGNWHHAMILDDFSNILSQRRFPLSRAGPLTSAPNCSGSPALLVAHGIGPLTHAQ